MLIDNFIFSLGLLSSPIMAKYIINANLKVAHFQVDEYINIMVIRISIKTFVHHLSLIVLLYYNSCQLFKMIKP